jgi:hypothetical protein
VKLESFEDAGSRREPHGPEEARGANLYRKRAGLYDLSANLYYLIGFREQHYRQRRWNC